MLSSWHYQLAFCACLCVFYGTSLEFCLCVSTLHLKAHCKFRNSTLSCDACSAIHSLYICIVYLYARISHCDSSFLRYVVTKSPATRFFGHTSFLRTDLLSASGTSMNSPGVTLSTLVNWRLLSLRIHTPGII